MPLQSVKLLPGVNIEVTPILGEAQIVDSQLIRFKPAGNMMLPEKLGGWQKFFANSVGSAIRDLHAWEGIRNDAHLSIGAEESLTIISDGSLMDVTPHYYLSDVAVSFTTMMSDSVVTIDDANITASIYDTIYIETPISVGGLVLKGGYQVVSVLDADTYTIDAGADASATVTGGGAVPTFDTTADSPTITVTLNDHPYVVGAIFNIPESTATTVGGLTLSGAYVVQTVPTANTFTINAANAAATTDTEDMNGGLAQIAYYIGLGPLAAAGGYGVGGYGDGAYGIGVVPPPSTGSAITATNWSLDNWGEVLLACPATGPIYQYSPDLGIQNATRILNAPEINGGIFVSQPAQILVAWASSQDGVQDKLTVNWSDAGNYQNWTVSSQTQAGGYRLPTGSRIVGGMAGPNFGILWTDVDVWSMDYVEPPLIFGFNSLGANCGLVSQHAAVTLNSTVFWMSYDKFCLLNGENVQTVPCTVWDFVFQNIDTDHLDKVYAGSNSLFGEVVWYFPSLSGGTGECDSYVKLQVDSGLWDFGRLDRSAWIDQSPVGAPVGGSPTGYVYQHEISPDADGQPMMPYLQSGFFQIADGEQLNFVDWLFPDFKYGTYAGSQGAVLQITLLIKDYPNDVAKSVGPYSVSAATKYVNTRLRGRFAAIRIASSDLGSFWRLGEVKLRSAPDGKR